MSHVQTQVPDPWQDDLPGVVSERFVRTPAICVPALCPHLRGLFPRIHDAERATSLPPAAGSSHTGRRSAQRVRRHRPAWSNRIRCAATTRREHGPVGSTGSAGPSASRRTRGNGCSAGTYTRVCTTSRSRSPETVQHMTNGTAPRSARAAPVPSRPSHRRNAPVPFHWYACTEAWIASTARRTSLRSSPLPRWPHLPSHWEE